MDAQQQQANLRKLEWPGSAEQAVGYIHAQCQKFSQSGVPSPQELSCLIEFIDEFIFSASKGVKPGKKPRRPTNIQQLQLIQILSDYFTSDTDFNLLCSVFMIIFMVQGRDVEYKVSTLARLLSLALATNAVSILNFGGVWVTQQTPTSPHSLTVAQYLVQDYLCTQSQVCRALHHLPRQSPLFTANLIAAMGELYSRVGGMVLGEVQPTPPSQVVELVTTWLKGSPQLTEGGARSGQPAIPVTGTSPVASLLSWSVLAPLSGQQGETYSLLHHTLLNTILGDGTKVPPKYLVHLTESLLTRLSSGEHTEPLTCLALDRFGQLLGAVIRSGSSPPDKDLVTLVNQLPANRLVHIVLASIS